MMGCTRTDVRGARIADRGGHLPTPLGVGLLAVIALLGVSCPSGDGGLQWVGYEEPEPADDDDDDDSGVECNIFCECEGDISSLTVWMDCGEGSPDCTFGYDTYGRVDHMVCEYDNAVVFECLIDYDNLGRAHGTCSRWPIDTTSCSFWCDH